MIISLIVLTAAHKLQFPSTGQSANNSESKPTMYNFELFHIIKVYYYSMWLKAVEV